MTDLTRPVRRVVRGDGTSPLVVTLTQEGVHVRELGARVEYPAVPYGYIHLQAARLYNAEQARANPRRNGRA